MGNPPVKSTKKLTKARLEAEAAFKISSKGIESTLVDMINRIDPLELMAVSATTFIVYDIIKTIPELAAQATAGFMETEKKLFLGVFYPLFSELYNRVFAKEELTEEQKKVLTKIRETPDLVLFVKSFAIAYIIVKHSGQIISGVGNITGFIGTFLGLKWLSA